VSGGWFFRNAATPSLRSPPSSASPGPRSTATSNRPPPTHAHLHDRQISSADSRVGLGRGGRVTPAPFPQAARRTGRAALTASGSPRMPFGRGPSGCPGGRDVAPIAVAPNGHCRRVEQHDPVCRDRTPPPSWVGEPSPDVLPPPAVLVALPAHDSPPHEPTQVVQRALRDGMLEVVGPTT